jgi:hypothetical protein
VCSIDTASPKRYLHIELQNVILSGKGVFADTIKTRISRRDPYKGYKRRHRDTEAKTM